MSFTTSRTRFTTSTYALVVISPATNTVPVVVAVSQATRESGSCFRHSSSIPSETWSHSLSGWPSVTDSLVKRTRSDSRNDSTYVPAFQDLVYAVCSLVIVSI